MIAFTAARKPLLLSLAALAIAAPGAAAASSLYHAAGGEVGYTSHPDHLLQGGKARGEVLNEVSAARQDGTLAILARGGTLPAKATAPARTREQVRQEFLAMTDAEKRRLQEMHGAGG